MTGGRSATLRLSVDKNDMIHKIQEIRDKMDEQELDVRILPRLRQPWRMFHLPCAKIREARMNDYQNAVEVKG
jgi:hypothetical protein